MNHLRILVVGDFDIYYIKRQSLTLSEKAGGNHNMCERS